MVNLEDISLVYGKDDYKKEVLKHISLNVQQGEFVTVTGRSGCGKTSLLNIIGGIARSYVGRYYFENNDVKKFKEKELASFRNKNIGFIVQHFALINDLSVYENVAMPLIYRKTKKEQIKKSVDEILEKVGLVDKKRKLSRELSGGEKQRVAIARALIGDTKLIIADEPTGALDEKTGDEIMEIFKSLNEKGKTIIMVTHDMEYAKLGSKQIKIKDGEIII